MSIPFLQLVAQNIYERFGSNMDTICIVFPNRRSILFFNKYLSQVVSKPVWAPQCTTISDFIQSFSTLNKADNLLLVFDLYKVYCQVRNISEPLDNFFYWGELMLSDFDDIDKYMVDAQNLFQNLAALKNINERFSYLDEKQIEAIQQFWKSFGQSRKSDQQKMFSDIWSSMYFVYDNFRKLIKDKGIAYEGMIYRQVAESIMNNSFNEPDYKKICFVGFNALNECEKVIFKSLNTDKKALFYWDYCTSYIQQPHFEAGYFIRQNILEFPSALGEQHFNNRENPGKIEMIAIPSNVGQAKVAGQIISQIYTTDTEPEKTAILLPDESLLMPVLHSTPPNINDINITMGYPVKNAPVMALIEAIGQLHIKAKINSDSRNTQYFYKHVFAVLSHPYIERGNMGDIKKLEQEIINRNIIYIKPSRLPHSELIDFIFQEPSNGIEFVNRLANIIKIIGQKSFAGKPGISEQPVGIESETLMVVYSAINRFADLLTKGDISFDIQLCFKLLMKILNGLTVPFEGEPLKGLQVMGFLESRAIDFDNVIILSVNEGILPKTNLPVSFIPYNLRRGFGLPSLEHRDAIYAYYFYRILQRSKNIFLLYNTTINKTGGSEMSRYATQLLYNNKYNITRRIQTFNIEPPLIPGISINKSPEIIETLKKYYNDSDNGVYLSPSALSSYIDCRLRFYFRYISNLKEYETASEEIDASMLGSILHRAMYIIYNPFLNNSIQKNHLTDILKNNEGIENAVFEAMLKEYFKEAVPLNSASLHGRNYIIFKIITKYIHQIIETDCRFTPFILINLEKNITTSFSINIPSGKVNVKVGGYIDRIDQTSDGYRIIDYKTGVVETKFSKFDEMFNPAEKKKAKKEILQALLYAVLYRTSNKDQLSVIPVIYNLRRIFTGRFDPLIYFDKQAIKDISEIDNIFTENFKKVLEEIFNPAIPFTQTNDLQKCKNCVYNIICHRESE